MSFWPLLRRLFPSPLLRRLFEQLAVASLGCLAGWLMFVIVWFLFGVVCVILCIFGCLNSYCYDWMGFGGFAAIYFGGLLVQ